MKFFLILLALATLSLEAAPFKKVPSSLNHFVTKCKKLEAGLFGNYACPAIERYQYKTDSDLQDLADLYKDKRIAPKGTTASEGVKVIQESIEHPISFVSELVPGFEAEDLETFEKAFKEYVALMKKFVAAITRAADGADTILVDESGSLKPQVSARALVLINKAKKSVTIVWHSDTER